MDTFHWEVKTPIIVRCEMVCPQYTVPVPFVKSFLMFESHEEQSPEATVHKGPADVISKERYFFQAFTLSNIFSGLSFVISYACGETLRNLKSFSRFTDVVSVSVRLNQTSGIPLPL